MKKRKKEQMIMAGVRLPREAWEKIKRLAEKEMTTTSQVIRKAVIEWLKKGEKE